MPHPNARLTVYARPLIVSAALPGWPQARIAEQLGVSRGTVRSGATATTPRAGPGSKTAPRARTPPRPAPATRSRPGPGAARGTPPRGGVPGRRARAGRLDRRADPGPPSGAGPGRHRPDHRRAGPATSRRARATSAAGPVSCSMSMSRSSGGSPTAAGGACTAATPPSPTGTRSPIGYDYLHVAVDDHSRLAYIEALPDEKDPTCAAFLHRAATWFHQRGVASRAGPHRQRHELPPRRDLGRGLCRAGHPAPVHQARLPLDQRQSRAPQPHPAHRVRLRPPLDQQHQRLAALDSWVHRLQHSPSPLRPRRPATHHPTRLLTT